MDEMEQIAYLKERVAYLRLLIESEENNGSTETQQSTLKLLAIPLRLEGANELPRP